MRLYNITPNALSAFIVHNFNRSRNTVCYSREGANINIFEVHTCDRCGGNCIGPNPVCIDKAPDFTAKVLVSLGIRCVKDHEMLGELSATDSGDAVCEYCYRKEVMGAAYKEAAVMGLG